MGIRKCIGNPVQHYRLLPAGNWDSVKLDKTAGHYRIININDTDMINWMENIDGKDNVLVKIRAKRAHWSGYEYLQSDTLGKYLRYDGNHKVYV